MLLAVALALLAIINSSFAQQRWYLTGAFENKTKPTEPFLGQTVSFADLCLPRVTESEDVALLFGGVVIRQKAYSLEPNLIENAEYVLNVMDSKKVPGCAKRMEVASNVSYDMFGSVDYTSTYGFEVGLYDHRSEKFVESSWRKLSLGRLVCLSVRLETSCVSPNIASTDTTADDDSVVASQWTELHDLMYSVDLRRRPALMSHTWTTDRKRSRAVQHHQDLDSADVSLSSAAMDSTMLNPISDVQSPPDVNVRVMTFNLWHNNPAAWVFGFEERHKRYIERMEHFADIVVAEAPDVVLVQEVRWDSAFGLKRLANLTSKPENARSRPFDVGSQVEHLKYFIAAAYSRSRGELGSVDKAQSHDPYQVVYEPAMLLQELDPRQGTGGRNEEGVAILIKDGVQVPFSEAKTLTKATVDYRLLPRWIADPKDDHQRALLHARVQLEVLGGEDNTELNSKQDLVLDVYTVHYSLSPRGRAMGVLDSWEFIHSHQDSSDLQILGGDFNAEPDEYTMQYLTAAAADGMSKKEKSGGELEVVLDEMGELVSSFVKDAGADGVCDTVYHNSLASLRNDGAKNSSPCPDFTDAWVWKAENLRRVSSDSGSSPSELDMLGYTFPACNPVKRIDYLMVRNTTRPKTVDTGGEKRWRGQITDTRIVGQQPTADTVHLATGREGLGMLDKDSPVWASDHFGVVVDVRLSYQ